MAAKKGNNYAKGNKGGGRKTDYKKEYSKIAYEFCLLGYTDQKLADAFGVTERTINKWKRREKEFSSALKKGKNSADAKVAASLYKRAIGYEFKEIHFEKVDSKEVLEKAPDSSIENSAYKKKVIVKEVPPDPLSIIFWLKNRQPKLWRDKQEHELTGANGGPIETTQTVVILPSNQHESKPVKE